MSVQPLQYRIQPIADVTSSKRHKGLDEILIIFTRTIQEISKAVCKKTMSETHAFIGKLMLRKQDCVKFRGHIAWQSFFENNFADFSDVVRVKKIKILSSRWWHFQLATSSIWGSACPRMHTHI